MGHGPRTRTLLRALGAAGLGAIVLLAAGIPDLPARAGALALLVLLATPVWAGRRPRARVLGPVGPDRRQRAARTGGVLLVGGGALRLLLDLRTWANGNPASEAAYLLFTGGVLTAFLLACLVVTRRRSRVGPAELWASLLLGLVGALVWLGWALARPTLPASADPAVLASIGAATATVLWTSRRGRAGTQRGLPGLWAGAVTALSASVLAGAVLWLLPARVPDVVGPVMPPGTTVAQRLQADRIEADDPNVALLALGGLCALGLAVGATPEARRRRPATTVRQAG